MLQRVTIVASRPDDTRLYIRADYSTYSPTADSSASTAMVPGAGRHVALPPRWSGGSYGASRGIELYASTQRILAARTAALDVHA